MFGLEIGLLVADWTVSAFFYL